MIFLAALAVVGLCILIYFAGAMRARASAGERIGSLHSRPSYHGFFCVLWTAMAGFVVWAASIAITGTQSDNALKNRLYESDIQAVYTETRPERRDAEGRLRALDGEIQRNAEEIAEIDRRATQITRRLDEIDDELEEAEGDARTALTDERAALLTEQQRAPQARQALLDEQPGFAEQREGIVEELEIIASRIDAAMRERLTEDQLAELIAVEIYVPEGAKIQPLKLQQVVDGARRIVDSERDTILRQLRASAKSAGDTIDERALEEAAQAQIETRYDPLTLEVSQMYEASIAPRGQTVLIATVAISVLVALLSYFMVGQSFRARNRVERMVRIYLFAAAALAIVTTVGIVLSLVGETLLFVEDVLEWDISAFLFGTNWAPLAHQREGYIDAEDVGWLPVLAGSVMITVIAMLVAVPVGLMSAIYLSDFASQRTRSVAKPILEILAGIPTVVYGYFAVVTVSPSIKAFGENYLGLAVDGSSALAAGIVMGIMIIPFISSLSDDVINAVPQSLRDASYGLGATKAETIRKVILPAALPGIVSAVILGVSRAIGETMIVVMAAGQGPNLTANPLEPMTTVTVQIVSLITGDTDAALAGGPAFTLGFALFIFTLTLNYFALRIVRKYRELYD